jgi:prepilin-type processing-associated H-X9-DG protein
MTMRHNAGMFTRESSVRIRDVRDGTSNTVMAAEVQVGRGDADRTAINHRNSAAGDLNTAVGTSNARRFSASAANLAAIKTYHAACAAGAAASANGADDEAGRWWASGAVFRGPWFNTLMPPNTPFNCDNDVSVTDMRLKSASSYHTGGVQVLLADGSVRFTTENIDHGLWVGLGTPKGGEVLGEW